MGKYRLVVFSLIFVFLASAKPVLADIYVPKGQCPDNYRYFDESQINPSEYRNIAKPNPDELMPFIALKGYCVQLKEYCLKNHCPLPLVLETVDSAKSIHAYGLLINVVINTLLVLLIYALSKTPLKLLLGIKSILGIVALTILGYVADLFALFVATISVTNKCRLTNDPLCGGTWYKSSFEEQLASPYSLMILSIAVPIIFFLVSLNFYYFYSKNVSEGKKYRILYSGLFGILSNPIWIYLGRALLLLK